MAAYSFIDNINDFFSTGYFTEDFQKKVFDKSGYSQEGIKELCTRFSALRQQYNRYKQAVTSRYAREKDKERETFDFNSKLLECLGYYKATVKEQPAAILSLPIGENGAQQDVPVRIVCNRTDGSPQLYVMDIPTLVSASDDTDAETGFAELGLDRLVTHIFSLPEQEHPRYILMSSGNMVFFMDADKWERGAYLRFDIERLLVETTQSAMRNYFALFYLLVSREALAAIGDTPLMQQLEEESYKNAYAVTQDLKRGVVAAVEALANEAIWYIKHTPDNKFHDQDETDDNFETMMRDDCLVFIYRLLFIFYAESRPDLDILPINDQTYQRGYSLEMLRDLEQVNLITAEELNGYFFDHSIKRLFALILRGYNEDRVDASSMTASFRVRHIDSPLFSDTKLKVLVGVKFRNVVWQSIVCQLSLSQKQKGKPRGRISYANLGINQLGSVYENLLAYRGFYAEEDYIEVHPKGDLVETYLQPRSRRDVFEEDEILKDEEGHDIIHPRGKFIYRLNGRDRKKSASFYTPEVLTKSTVKYTLKPIVEKLERGEIKASDLLQMKILEPAMGAAAFQNEVINQLAVLYLQFRKQEVGETIDPLQYPNELQKVKAFIATSNVYGVDLNATAIELGKLSLWLNVMHKDMEVPFFSNRLAEGNAVIGAWLKVYKKSDVMRTIVGQRAYDKKWWETPTHRIHFSDSRLERHYTEVYHFLLPVQDMLGILNAKLPTFSNEEEQKLKEKKKAMANIRKSWLKGISGEEYKQLERISRKIDVLLKKYVEFQMGVAEYANNGYAVWKYAGKRTLPFETNAQREEFDDQRYRKVMYRRLQYHFQYQNALNLFPIAHRRKYSANIYTGLKDEISFDSISNLFHPKTVDDCYMHNGQGICEGIKGKDGKWNLAGHKNRIVHYNAKYIKLLSDTFEDGRYPDCAKLVSVHNNEMLGILDKISNYERKVSSVRNKITVCFDETGAPKEGLIKDVRSHTCYPSMENCEMIYNAPQFYVSNPVYQTPKEVSLKKGDFNIVDLEKISDEYIQRTKYLPLVGNYRSLSTFNAFVIGQDEHGNDIYDSLLDHYKVGFRKMVNLSGERSLICAVLPRRTAHIHGVISISFLDRNYTVDMAALCSSIVMDFYWKTIATQNITESRLATFPFGIKKKFKSAMYSRTLMLNCLNKYYDDLWSGCWCESFRTDSWSLEDARLKPFSELTPSWNHDTPLRNHFERRQALVEIDVLAAMSFGLSLEDLEFIYDIQFPVLRQNEDDTWYDQKGNVVYSVSLCKKGVGVDRATWNTIRGEQLSDNIYQGATSSYIHTVPVEKSELYGGEQVTYYAPYTRCDRIADYQRAWTFFEERFKNED